LQRYHEVMDAYLSGLEDRLLAGGEIENIHSVASFFISRVDSHIDPRLPADSPLRGKAAIANAKLAYEEFRAVFGGARFGKLQMAKANLQRPLWASTSAKNPAYPDTLYVDSLIGPATVNTVPPATLQAFMEHGTAAETLLTGLEEARQNLQALAQAGIDMDSVTAQLEAEGVKAFEDAFTTLLQTVEDRRALIVSRLGALAQPTAARIADLNRAQAAARIWNIDPTLWTADPAGQAEIKIRLGWLTLPETSRALLPEAQAFAAEVRAAGFQRVLLLGMGGSSLAPEVMSRVFASEPASQGQMRFAILDSTDPMQVAETAAQFPPQETLYIVSSKSGGTAEVSAMLEFCWAQTGGDGSHFVAITDPGTSLQKLAQERGFRKIFTADPHVGGRYSALSAFGLVPAALMGIDPQVFLARAAWMSEQCLPEIPAERNPGLTLGALMAQAAQAGRDKLTILADPGLESIGSWMEQLIAESTGKQGVGVVPVDLEPLGAEADYGSDRLFVYLRRNGDHDAALNALSAAGQPLVVFPVSDPYDLAAEFYRWEFATAVACAALGVNAFDQPDVQDAKDRTKAKIAEYKAQGALPAGQFVLAREAQPALEAFLAQAQPGDYVAINAYLRRNPAMEAALTELRTKIRARTGCATTVGFGPRFLHSTGQLHKGGAPNGLFLQITADSAADLEIPTQGMTFGTLEQAQALGDYEALAARDRRILRIHLTAREQLRSLTVVSGSGQSQATATTH
jgi:transaldolase/glucose-6-phosphate isomerase